MNADTQNLAPVRRALLSVSDKTGLEALGLALADRGVEILSTGGTAKTLAGAGIPVTEVSDVTGFPEIMDGRVKTLHPRIHGGLLGLPRLAHHAEAMESHGITAIDLLVVNLYPFEETVARGGSYTDHVETIDIGGPAMIRAASKTHERIAVVVDVEDYDGLLAELDANGGATSALFRRKLAATAFARTAAYDAAIAGWLNREVEDTSPRRFVMAGSAPREMRYGENPHQTAVAYETAEQRAGVMGAEILQGKALSYNNLSDTDAAYELVAEFDTPAVAIIKHANPCGVAVDDSLLSAYMRARACDPVSAFGGIVALNRPLDEETARAILEIFTEVVIAPEVTDGARAVFAAKQNVRLLTAGGLPDPATPGLALKPIAGGLLVQDRDAGSISPSDLQVVTKRAPTDQEMRDLIVAFRVAKHVKSNAIVYVKDGATAGIGAGQMSRVDSSRIAAIKAKEAAQTAGLPEPLTIGSAVASDAFFPFPDGLLAAAEAGATAVIQPGGSMRDDAVIAAADEKGLAMVLTGMRHFRH